MVEIEKVRRKWLYWIGGLALLGLGLPLGGLYLWLALAPSTSEKFEKEHQEALAETNALLAPRRDAPAEDHARALARPNTTAQRAKPDLIQTIQRLNERNHPGDGSLKSLVGGVIFYHCYLPQPLPPAGKALETLGDDPAVRQAILTRAGWIEEFLAKFHEDGTSSTMERSVALNRDLDDIEQLLLGEGWEAPDFSEFPLNAPTTNLGQLIALAILRAELHGDESKAALLLERGVEALRVIHLGRFPLEDDLYELNSGPSVLEQIHPDFHYGHACFSASPSFMAGESTLMPRESLERAGGILRNSLLTPEMFQKMSAAHIIRANRFLRENRIPLADNGWHRLMGGVPEQLVYHAMYPIWSGHPERLRNAFNNLPNETILRKPGQYFSLDMLTVLSFASSNIDFRQHQDLLESIIREPSIWAGKDGEFFNRPIQFARLVLATESWRRDHGHYPENIRELIPGYLEPAFADLPFKWVLYRFECPARPTRGTGPGTPTTGPAPRAELPIFCQFFKNQQRLGVEIGYPLSPRKDEELLELLCTSP